MSADAFEKDLVVLAADKDIEMALRGILGRPQALGIRAIAVEYLVHPEHDPGCVRTSYAILRSYAQRCAHAIVVMDHEGSGQESTPRTDLESRIEANLDKNGWRDRAATVVISPELENWVWSDSPEVVQQLGWTGRPSTLRRWLEEQESWSAQDAKPTRPKEAMERAIREVRKPWSSAIHGGLARKVSFKRCSDPAFKKLSAVLRNWFPKS